MQASTVGGCPIPIPQLSRWGREGPMVLFPLTQRVRQPQASSNDLGLSSPRAVWDGVAGSTVMNKMVPRSGKLLARLWAGLGSSAKHGSGLVWGRDISQSAGWRRSPYLGCCERVAWSVLLGSVCEGAETSAGSQLLGWESTNPATACPQFILLLSA